MKVVIDIPNWLYNAIMECKEPQYSKSLGDAVRDGIPLPKGHGRLIDVSEYFKKEFGDAREFLDKASTIIEADRSEEE